MHFQKEIIKLESYNKFLYIKYFIIKLLNSIVNSLKT